MSRFVTADNIEGLKARAESLRPRAPNVVATARGWEQARPNGSLELLVSFAGLDSLLGEAEPAVGEPVEVVVPAVQVQEESASVEGDAEVAQEEAKDEAVEESAPVKKAGRPKKVAA